MTIELAISPETEAKLRAYAASAGLNLESFVVQALSEMLGDVETGLTAARQLDDRWSQKLSECIDLHPTVSHFVDDSRESIYAGRGE